MAAYEVEEMRHILADAINRMPEREKIVLTLYYYEGLTLAEIGQVLGVTESRVCQIHTKAILSAAFPLVRNPIPNEASSPRSSRSPLEAWEAVVRLLNRGPLSDRAFTTPAHGYPAVGKPTDPQHRRGRSIWRCGTAFLPVPSARNITPERAIWRGMKAEICRWTTGASDRGLTAKEHEVLVELCRPAFSGAGFPNRHQFAYREATLRDRW